ncbi:hypothetical protein ABVT39_000837 [Epinephelus coioides]
MFKMRGLTLLCLFGLILTVSTVKRVKPWPKGGRTPLSSDDKFETTSKKMWPEGSQFPMEGNFNTTNTTNTSTVQQERQNNISAVWVGTREPIDSNDGFPPSSDGDNTQGKTNQ